ncbi:MAG: hypothetical protein GX589_04530 [Deltaproteobacteria bacterium]|nr:hypothetical protein [Deltaproteobacteria bacterium]
MNTVRSFGFCLAVTVSFLFGRCLDAFGLPDSAEELCGDVLCGAILSVASECFNDSTAQVVCKTQPDRAGWQYSLDSADDSNGDEGIYEIYALATRETQNQVEIVIAGNLPLTGFTHDKPSERVPDGNVGWGDLFINLTDDDILTASDKKALYAIRFADSNDSGAAELGVYGKVKAKSVSSTNNEYRSWGSYAEDILNQTPSRIAVLGDLGAGQTYYQTPDPTGVYSLNVIDEGELLGPIELMDMGDPASLGLDVSLFGAPPGVVLIGIRFQKRLIIDECGVIGGDGSSCLDCRGVYCGDAKVDQCLVCEGDGTSCLDCAGEPFGPAVDLGCGCNLPGPSGCDKKCGSTKVEDRCGVCGGDGRSCLGCKSVDQSGQYAAVKLHLRRQFRKIRRNLMNDKLDEKFRAKVLKQAREAYRKAVEALKALPTSVLNCSSVEFCVAVDVASSGLDLVTKQSKLMTKYNKRIVKRLMNQLPSTGACLKTLKECQRAAESRLKKIVRVDRGVKSEGRKVKSNTKKIVRFESKCS